MGALGAQLTSAADVPAGATQLQRPNVLVILADDLGWSDVGAFGSEIRTPNIDDLAAHGRIFTQFYNTARCCPSRASLLTGLYPHQAGVGHMLWPTGYPGYSTRLSNDCVTIAEVLREAGYRTYMTGKWHLSERVPDPNDTTGWPLARGFDEFYGTLAGYGSFYDPATLARGNRFITPENDSDYKPSSYYYTDAISDNSVAFLQQHRQQHADRPFFMYVAYTAAHWPIQAPKDSLAEYRGKYDAGYDAIRQARIAKLKQQGLYTGFQTPAPTTGDWDAVKDKAYEARRMEAFAAMITRMDVGIGKIIAHLNATGQLDDTLILYMHDNGGCDEEFFHGNQQPLDNLHAMRADELQSRTLPPMQTRDGQMVRTGAGVMAGPPESFVGYGPGWANVSNTPLRLVKKNTHEGGVSTPLIVHWPQGLESTNKTPIAKPAHLIDVMPTVLEVTGAAYPQKFHGQDIQPMAGVSLAPLFTGDGKFARQSPIFWEHEGNRAVRVDHWKLVSLENSPWELYDIDQDRGEMHNLAERHPAKVKQLAKHWDEYIQHTRVEPYGAHRLRERTADPSHAPHRLTLKSGDVVERAAGLALFDAGLKIEARISGDNPRGVIVAQGAGQHGFSLFVRKGRVHFTIRRAGALQTLATPAPNAASPVTITAELTRHGQARLQVGDQLPATADFYGPLLATPEGPLTVGRDDGTPVGKYPRNFPFVGTIESVVVEAIRP